MSKSKGNTIEPGELISQGYGADSIRIMELFIAPWDQAANWSIEGIGGMFRFVQRVWTLNQEFLEAPAGVTVDQPDLRRVVHQTIKKVSVDLDRMQFNTAISSMMELTNELYRLKAGSSFAAQDWRWALTTLAQLLAPFAPHIAEELWQDLGQERSIHTSVWPKYDEKYLATDQITIVVQVNGRVRANISVPSDASEEQIVETATLESRVQEYIKDKELRKTVYISKKLVNFVV